jgi:hypothetical protein
VRESRGVRRHQPREHRRVGVVPVLLRRAACTGHADARYAPPPRRHHRVHPAVPSVGRRHAQLTCVRRDATWPRCAHPWNSTFAFAFAYFARYTPWHRCHRLRSFARHGMSPAAAHHRCSLLCLRGTNAQESAGAYLPAPTLISSIIQIEHGCDL